MMRTLILAASICFVVLPARADTTSREMLDRVRQLSKTTRKWTDSEQHLKIRIIDRRGGERNRELVILRKKYPEDRNRSVVFFEAPPEVKGVGFLQWSDPHAADEQWLYLPELKRVRQISGGAKRESFAGTDFSYDDLAIIGQITDWTEADAKTEVLRMEPVDSQPCQVIEFIPRAKDITYGKLLVWLRIDDLVVVKYQIHEQSGRLEKVLTLGDVRTVGSIPTAFHMEMQNVQNGSRTVVDFTGVKFDTGLDDSRFTQRSLEHGL